MGASRWVNAGARVGAPDPLENLPNIEKMLGAILFPMGNISNFILQVEIGIMSNH